MITSTINRSVHTRNPCMRFDEGKAVSPKPRYWFPFYSRCLFAICIWMIVVSASGTQFGSPWAGVGIDPAINAQNAAEAAARRAASLEAEVTELRQKLDRIQEEKIREAWAEQLMELGIPRYTYSIRKDNVHAVYYLKDGTILQYHKKHKHGYAPDAVTIAEALLRERQLEQQSPKARNYRSKNSFIQSWVSFRLKTASQAEWSKYSGAIEGQRKAFTKALLEEGKTLWKRR